MYYYYYYYYYYYNYPLTLGIFRPAKLSEDIPSFEAARGKKCRSVMDTVSRREKEGSDMNSLGTSQSLSYRSSV